MSEPADAVFDDVEFDKNYSNAINIYVAMATLQQEQPIENVDADQLIKILDARSPNKIDIVKQLKDLIESIAETDNSIIEFNDKITGVVKNDIYSQLNLIQYNEDVINALMYYSREIYLASSSPSITSGESKSLLPGETIIYINTLLEKIRKETIKYINNVKKTFSVKIDTLLQSALGPGSSSVEQKSIKKGGGDIKTYKLPYEEYDKIILKFNEIAQQLRLIYNNISNRIVYIIDSFTTLREDIIKKQFHLQTETTGSSKLKDIVKDIEKIWVNKTRLDLKDPLETKGISPFIDGVTEAYLMEIFIKKGKIINATYDKILEFQSDKMLNEMELIDTIMEQLGQLRDPEIVYIFDTILKEKNILKADKGMIAKIFIKFSSLKSKEYDIIEKEVKKRIIEAVTTISDENLNKIFDKKYNNLIENKRNIISEIKQNIFDIRFFLDDTVKNTIIPYIKTLINKVREFIHDYNQNNETPEKIGKIKQYFGPGLDNTKTFIKELGFLIEEFEKTYTANINFNDMDLDIDIFTHYITIEDKKSTGLLKEQSGQFSNLVELIKRFYKVKNLYDKLEKNIKCINLATKHINRVESLDRFEKVIEYFQSLLYGFIDMEYLYVKKAFIFLTEDERKKLSKKNISSSFDAITGILKNIEKWKAMASKNLSKCMTEGVTEEEEKKEDLIYEKEVDTNTEKIKLDVNGIFFIIKKIYNHVVIEYVSKKGIVLENVDLIRNLKINNQFLSSTLPINGLNSRIHAILDNNVQTLENTIPIKLTFDSIASSNITDLFSYNIDFKIPGKIPIQMGNDNEVILLYIYYDILYELSVFLPELYKYLIEYIKNNENMYNQLANINKLRNVVTFDGDWEYIYINTTKVIHSQLSPYFKKTFYSDIVKEIDIIKEKYDSLKDEKYNEIYKLVRVFNLPDMTEYLKRLESLKKIVKESEPITDKLRDIANDLKDVSKEMETHINTLRSEINEAIINLT